jgi:hypothetical protein
VEHAISCRLFGQVDSPIWGRKAKKSRNSAKRQTGKEKGDEEQDDARSIIDGKSWSRERKLTLDQRI